MRARTAKIPATVVLVTLVFLAVPRPGPAASYTCSTPGAAWERTLPTNVQLDSVKLGEAIDWATRHGSLSVLVIRNGCLAGWSRLDRHTAELPLDGWSMTKSVTSMIVGRAVTMGLFDIDAPLARWIPEADAAHGALTARHLLTMGSGLHHNWFRDPPFAGELMPDQVADALSLPFDHAPGTVWAYQQTPVTLLLHLVERAVGVDIQDWAQHHLFGPIGIEPGTWSWERDRAGHTEGWAHLSMRPVDWARLGYLMLHGGSWNGTQLISTAYHAHAISRVPISSSYGLLFWLNGGDRYPLPDIDGPAEGTGDLWPGAPADTYAFVGMRNQRVWVIPSLDMVIVRMGEPGEVDVDARNSVWQSQPGEIDHEVPRLIVQAVKDVAFPDPGPYRRDAAAMPSLEGGLVGDAQNADDVMAALGVPGFGPRGCTPAGCD